MSEPRQAQNNLRERCESQSSPRFGRSSRAGVDFRAILPGVSFALIRSLTEGCQVRGITYQVPVPAKLLRCETRRLVPDTWHPSPHLDAHSTGTFKEKVPRPEPGLV